MTMTAQFPQEATATGEFKRQEDAFRDWVSNNGSTPYPAVTGRYHLYVSLACPWANRTAIVRQLKGLETVISMSITDPLRDERGWAFREGHGHGLDLINHFSFLSEAYHATEPGFDGRYTVPVLWDKETHRIINNSEDDICRMFNDSFNEFGRKDVNLFPPEIADEQARTSAFIYDNINNGVYKAGFASRQRAYEFAARNVFKALDELEERLATRRYLFGDRTVETDWRLFCTLVRFDAVYYLHFKCNLRRIADYPNLQGYLKDLYQQPGVAGTINM
ncbi:MAG: glutathione S-transferase-like protein, partial [Verrucomicrobiales bacterium]|nr:glutathione S-transferase-like protein [Verrucomicrobiales bacterium]